VYAEYIPMDLTANQPLKLCRLIAEDCFKDSDLIVILGGSFGPKQGASYIEISSAENFRKNCGRL
jgi:pyruvate kinase